MQPQVTGYWLEEALAAEGSPEVMELEGEARADIAILGGGFTGLWTAIHIKALDPAAEVAIVEKNLCGSGASGRNGGFCMTWSSKMLPLVAACGRQEALRLLRASQDAVDAIGSFCQDHGIDAQFRQDGWLWSASNAAQLDSWRATLEELDALGAQVFEEVEGEEAARRAGSPVALGGIYEAKVATLQPGRLGRGLKRVAAEKGVRIYERSPVTRLERGDPVRLQTAKGTLTSQRAVLALNAWAAELPEFRSTILPVGVDMIITEPIADILAQSGLGSGLAVSDSRLFVHFYRSTPDGRLAMGKGGSRFFYGSRVRDSAEGPARNRPRLEASVRRFFGHQGALPIASNWHGPVTRTMSGLPHFGSLKAHPNIAYGHGYCGNGVGPTYNGGRILAALALERDDEWTSSPLVEAALGGRFPPEPLRFFGAKLVSGAVARAEQAADENRPPSRLDSALARLSPAGLVPIKKS